MNGSVTVTREVNGNHALRVGDDLRSLLDLNAGDYVTVKVVAVHRGGSVE